MDSLLRGELDLGHIPWQDREKIHEISDRARDYPIPFARVLSSLSRIFSFIDRSPTMMIGSLEEKIKAIRIGCGIDPLSILHSSKRLADLISQVVGLVTPEKLAHFLETKPPMLNILTPSGQKVRVKDYKYVHYGEHDIEGVCFTCVPSLAYSPTDLASLKKDEIHRFGDTILLRSDSQIEVVLNDYERDDIVRELWCDGLES